MIFLGIGLGSIRFIVLFLAAPVFGHRAISPMIRLALAISVAWGVGALSIGEDLVRNADELRLGQVVLSEVLVGATLGFATRLVFAAFGLAGEVISVQGGLGAATVLDPTSGSSSVALASLLQVVATLIYLAMGGHHEMLRAAVLGLERMPLGQVVVAPALLGEVVSLGAGVFEIAVRLAAPITGAMLLANLGVGVLGRFMPQLNLMTVQLPALVGLTLLLLGMGASPFVDGAANVLEQWTTGVGALTTGGH